jgi:hypothetical protein
LLDISARVLGALLLDGTSGSVLELVSKLLCWNQGQGLGSHQFSSAQLSSVQLSSFKLVQDHINPVQFMSVHLS